MDPRVCMVLLGSAVLRSCLPILAKGPRQRQGYRDCRNWASRAAAAARLAVKDGHFFTNRAILAWRSHSLEFTAAHYFHVPAPAGPAPETTHRCQALAALFTHRGACLLRISWMRKIDETKIPAERSIRANGAALVAAE